MLEYINDPNDIKQIPAFQKIIKPWSRYTSFYKKCQSHRKYLASNLWIVELTMALYLVLDFQRPVDLWCRTSVLYAQDLNRKKEWIWELRHFMEWVIPWREKKAIVMYFLQWTAPCHYQQRWDGYSKRYQSYRWDDCCGDRRCAFGGNGSMKH